MLGNDDVIYNHHVISPGVDMPYRNNPEALRPSIQALALVERWREDAESSDLPRGEDLALWWIDQGFADLEDAQAIPVMRLRKWRQLARHVHLWASIHDSQHRDLVGMMLGIENDWIPEPRLTFDPQGRLLEVVWKAPLHRYARPPLGLECWQLPLRCIGYERPAWREAPLRGTPQQGRAHASGSWWC
jgi:hypothetical protein